MAWWNHTRQKLAGALDRIDSLKSRLDDLERENAGLRRMLQMKNEECESLLNRCRHMQSRSDYADTLEEKVAETEQQIDRFIKLKESYTRKIDRLRMERDEARAMLKARDETPDTILPIDFSTLPAAGRSAASPVSRHNWRKSPQAPAAKSAASPASRHNWREASDAPAADSDWYQPLPDNL